MESSWVGMSRGRLRRKAVASFARPDSRERLSPHGGWLCILATMVLTGCATMSPPQPPSLELAKPPTDLRAVRKGDEVILTWTIPTVTTDRQTVRKLGATRICRGMEDRLTQCGTPVGEVTPVPAAATKSSKQKPGGSYHDLLSALMESESPSADNVSEFVTYAVEVLNAEGRDAGRSNPVRVSTARTLPPPRDFSARVTNQGVVLTWTNELPAANSAQAVQHVYRVFRRPEGSHESHLVGEATEGEGSVAVTDSGIEWGKTYEYHAETVTVVAPPGKAKLEVEGEDSPEIKVFADDVFPPAVPSGLQAVFSGPGQKSFIDLAWAPVSDADLDGYNVYRHEEGSTGKGSAAVKVNASLVKEPAYRDASVGSGKIYMYSVSAVDVRGNESARSEEASERVP